MSHSLGEVLKDWLEKTDLAKRSKAAEVILRWPEIAGPDNARHTMPVSLAQGELTVSVVATPGSYDANTWALNLSLLAPMFLEKIEAAVGVGVVTKIRFVAGWRGRERRAGPGRGLRGGPAAAASAGRPGAPRDWPSEADLAGISLSPAEQQLLRTFAEKACDPDLARASGRWLSNTLKARHWAARKQGRPGPA